MNKEISELKDQINKDEDDVKFEISDIKYTYIDKSRKSSVVDSITIRDEEYKGLGMVNATGKNVKNTTYYLLLNYTKKGGSKQDKITNGQISVIVSKGTGVIETYDNAFMEDDIFT